jgi:hypothetical protein
VPGESPDGAVWARTVRLDIAEGTSTTKGPTAWNTSEVLGGFPRSEPKPATDPSVTDEGDEFSEGVADSRFGSGSSIDTDKRRFKSSTRES